MKSACVALGVSLALALPGCGGPDLRPAQTPHLQLISESYAPAEVRAALVRALSSRRFSAEAEEAGHITARYQRGQEMARVVVDYTPTQFGVRYVDSAGFDATTDASGVVLVNKRYDDLVARLEKAIADELGRPAKQRAQSEKQEREYQLMLAAAQNPAPQIVAAPPADDGSQAGAPQPDDNGGAPPAPTIVQNNVTENRYVTNNVVRRDVVVNNAPRPAARAPLTFCDKPVKAVWNCPNPPALEACKRDRGKCSAVCSVGGGC